MVTEATGKIIRIPLALAAGTTAVVAAVAGLNIRVLQIGGTAAGSATLKWQSASTDLTGAASLDANQELPGSQFNPAGHFETSTNEALNAVVTSANVNGWLVYQLVKGDPS